ANSWKPPLFFDLRENFCAFYMNVRAKGSGLTLPPPRFRHHGERSNRALRNARILSAQGSRPCMMSANPAIGRMAGIDPRVSGGGSRDAMQISVEVCGIRNHWGFGSGDYA